MNAILKLELLALKKRLGESIDEIKTAFMPTDIKENRSAAELIEGYEKEKQLLKKYKCNNTSEMVTFLVQIEAASQELTTILHYNDR